MADRDDVPPGGSEHRSGAEEQRGGGLTEAQGQVLDRCLHALQHAKNDSHTLAALLLITRLCPASQLDKPTLRRVFEAVGLDLPARLLVTAIRGSQDSGLPPYELLSLGSALLAALSTDPDMSSHPQLLATVPLLLGLLSGGQNQAGFGPEYRVRPAGPDSDDVSDDVSDAGRPSAAQEASRLDEALAADWYQVLMAVCASPRGPEQLLSRGAVPALCQAVLQTLSQQRALLLLGQVLSGKTKDRAWSRHPAELLSLLLRLCRDFCGSSDQNRLGMCAQLVQFLPPAGVEGPELRGAVRLVWGALRPMLQAKLTPRQIGSVLVLSACLLDLYGWELVGPPKFCCLLVNRACVEVRMGLEEPPGTDLSPELQQTLTGCYRIMEAAIEQACSAGDAAGGAPPQATPPQVTPTQATPTQGAPPQATPTQTVTHKATPTQATPHMVTPNQAASAALSLKQTRQVLGVLEEACSAVMYYLQQVDPSRYDDPFIFASFRFLGSWLAEETSCLKQEVTRLLPLLIGYSRHHLQARRSEQGLSDWMSRMCVEGGAWTGAEPLRYLLPALCYLSAEEAPRKVLLTLDTPTLLVDFLLHSWFYLGSTWSRDPSMETASSALLNFTVTEPESVRTESCFRTLEAHLSEALPVLVNKPRLLVLTANYCTLGLMMSRLDPPPAGSVEADQRRLISGALRFLCGALDCDLGRVQVSPVWEEAAELWHLSLQVLASCIRTRSWIPALLRDEGWLRHVLAVLSEADPMPDRNTREVLDRNTREVLDRDTREVLEDALCAAAERCLVCRRDISHAMKRSDEGALSTMKRLRKTVVQPD